MNSFIPDIELSDTDKQLEYQENLLRKQIDYLANKSPFYKDMFNSNRIDVAKIKHIDDLKNIPTTSKQELQQRNSDFFCTESIEFIDITTSSGTSGHPVIIPLTTNDMKRLAYNEKLSLGCAGIVKTDKVQIMTTLDRRFMAGMAYFMGLAEIGASVIRAGSGSPAFQMETIELLKPNAIITVPSFIIKLIEFAQENHIDVSTLPVKKFITIGDNIREKDFSLNSLGARIESNWPLPIFSTYASSEMGAAFTECDHHQGGHHHPELIVVEFLDNDGNTVFEGEEGELTITTLGNEAMPLLRFRTGDICSFYAEPCKCGRKTIRIGPVTGRKNQMIKAFGTSIYPPALFDILDEFPFIETYIIFADRNILGIDELEVRLGIQQNAEFNIDIVRDRFRSKLRFVPKIVIDQADRINKIISENSGTKIRKFIDLRNNI